MEHEEHEAYDARTCAREPVRNAAAPGGRQPAAGVCGAR